MPARGPGQPIGLVDCLRALRGCEWSGAVRVRHSSGQGSVWVHRGEVVHAAYREQTGEAAYWQMAALSGVAVWIEEGPLPERRSITKQLPPPVPRSWERAMRHIALEELKALEPPAPGSPTPMPETRESDWAERPPRGLAPSGPRPLPLRAEFPGTAERMPTEPGEDGLPRLHTSVSSPASSPHIQFRTAPVRRPAPVSAPFGFIAAAAALAVGLLGTGYWLTRESDSTETVPSSSAPQATPPAEPEPEPEPSVETASAAPEPVPPRAEPVVQPGNEPPPVASGPAPAPVPATPPNTAGAAAPAAEPPRASRPASTTVESAGSEPTLAAGAAESASRAAAPPTDTSPSEEARPAAAPDLAGTSGSPAPESTPAPETEPAPAPPEARPPEPRPARALDLPPAEERPVDPELLDRAVEVSALLGEDDAVPTLRDAPPAEALEAVTAPEAAMAIAPDIALRLLVDEEGRVVTAVLRRSRPGFAAFEERALAVVRRYRFEPGRRSGEPVPVWINHSVRFH